MLNVEQLCRVLGPRTKLALMQREYRIEIPREFVKDAAKRDIVGSVLALDGGKEDAMLMRYRRDLIVPLSLRAKNALEELDIVLNCQEKTQEATTHLEASHLPAGSIICIDNRRWLHARNRIQDPDRHLRRVRWDAVPFPKESSTV